MAKRLYSAIAAAALATVGLGSLAAPATAAPAATPDFHATLKLAGCSGSLVRLPDSKDTDPALALSNGHCYDLDALGPGVVLTDKPDSTSFTVLDGAGTAKGTLQSNRMLYATMTDTDVSLFRLTKTYAQIKQSTGVDALTIGATKPAVGDPITVASGYFVEKWTCSIDKVVYQLKEADWTWKDSIRYTPECTTKHGTSGSPIIAADGSTVVGINNTGNDSGEKCTFDNPCEVDEQGNVDYAQGRNYGEQTYLIPGCFDAGNVLDTAKEGCALPKP